VGGLKKGTVLRRNPKNQDGFSRKFYKKKPLTDSTPEEKKGVFQVSKKGQLQTLEKKRS